jgi:hypothetical protein
MMTTTTNDNTTTTNTTTTTNANADADATAQPHEQPLPQPRERKPKWMRAPTPFEKQRGARLILEAAGLLRPRRRVVDVAVDAAVDVDGSSTTTSGAAAAVVVVEAAEAAAVVVAGEEEEEDERAAWRAMMALHRRLRAPAVVAATRRLFPAFVALAMRQDPGTHHDSDKKYDMTALPDVFVLAQHPHCFLVARKEEGEATDDEEQQKEEEEAQKKSALMMVDAGAALAETFEVLLNEFRLRPRRRYDNDARMTSADAPPQLLLQLRAYQDAVVAAVVSKKAAAPTRASSPSIISSV